jgi:DMSO/TMAO reductase YedYZ molybdopterin-dependent catalytic subunit
VPLQRQPLRRPVEMPLNTGVDPALLDGDSLSQDQMFRRNNFKIPYLPPTGFDVVVPGRAPRRVSMDLLQTFREVEVDLVLECAGNGRTLMTPVPDGAPWGLDAGSPISVVGVHLVDVLGVLPENIKSVVFTGADEGEVPIEGKQNYQFSITRDLAQSKLPILATHIGGEPLTLEHGAPVRLIVPGHYAMKSVKWLTRIEALSYRFQGHFVRKYRYFRDDIEEDSTPVGPISVRSVISWPLEEAVVSPGMIDVKGSAWTGNGEVTKVEVSADDGETWEEAELVRHSTGGRFAPVRWAAALALEPGTAVLVARATDSSGATQPIDSRWNSGGYANNVTQRVKVQIG